MNIKTMTIVVVAGAALLLTSCGPKAYVKGQYDDPQRENLMNDQWSETDMQVSVKTMVGSLVSHQSIANANKMPIVMVTNLQNKTSEHIDTQSIMDMVRVELTNSGRVAFVDKEAREDISKEYSGASLIVLLEENL